MKLSYRNQKNAEITAEYWNKPLDSPDWYKIEALSDDEAEILIYDVIGWPFNDAAELVHALAEMKEKKIREMLKAETWMTSKEAKEKGFVDTIVDGKAVKAQFDLSMFDNVPDDIYSESNKYYKDIKDSKDNEYRENLTVTIKKAISILKGEKN